MDDVTKLLATVERLGWRRGLTEAQIATAQSLAWYYRSRYRGPEDFALGHWARVAIRSTRNGRDLPGDCWTPPKDALNHSWQGAGMPEVMDPEPGPDVQAEHRELMALMLAELPETVRKVVELRQAGVANKDIARQLGRSEGRTSQMARYAAERFHRDE